MSNPKLPERASLEWLKRRAKDHLSELRQRNPHARLADAQLGVAREHGFSSWRALKSEVDQRRAPTLTAFFAACAGGDSEALRGLLVKEASLVRVRNAAGSTGLHLAARHPGALRLLIDHGADVQARDAGDNAQALHFAAGKGALEAVRVLLEAGADVHGVGDAHRLEVIGWATCFGASIPHDVVDLLVAHGARHHVFSAIALQDAALLQTLCEEDAEALTRRLSRFEQRQSALHYIVCAPDGVSAGGFRTGAHYALLELLIELGAELDAEDDAGRTPLMLAMLRGDREAMQRLHAAGARMPLARDGVELDARIAELGSNVKRLDAMLTVSDLRATIAWYRELGFELTGQHEADGELDWAGLTLGGVHLMLVPGARGHQRADLWLRASRLDELYSSLEQRQLARAAEALGGNDAAPAIRFGAKLHDTHYGTREFQLIDPNGYALNFSATSE